MTWWPSCDQTIQKERSNSYWDAIETVYDDACQIGSLPRWNWGELKKKYISERKYNEFIDAKAMKSRLPKELRSIDIGPCEIDLVDFLLNYSGDRAITLEGPRGAGKTSMLHFIEAAIYESGFKNFPVFLIIDCLDKERNISKEQMLKLLVGEIRVVLARAKGTLKEALNNLMVNIEMDLSFTGARNAFRMLSQSLAPQLFNRIVVVFDNLDQNYLDSISYGVELAKEIYRSSKVATITCLRPGCLEAITFRGDARAFFTYKIKVTAPKTIKWIESLGPKMKTSAQKLQDKNGTVLRPYDTKAQPEKIGRSAINLSKLLKEVKYDDVNVLNIMDAVAADDIRHLVLLTRRLLSHRSFPGKYLLEFDPTYPDYHPLTSLLEGSSFLFEKNKVIPNLLSFSDTSARCDFLISHRILLILSSNHHKTPLSSKKLLRILLLLGHEEVTILNCLAVLHELLLIRSTNAEFVDPKGPLPSAFFLTESGRLFLNHLLSSKDYVLTVILDVPLEHSSLKKALRKNPNHITFASQIDSLLEYTEKIMLDEEVQIERIKVSNDKEYTILPLSFFKDGGLLSRHLVECLISALESATYSKVLSAYNAKTRIKRGIDSLSSWLASSEKLLDEIYKERIAGKELSPRKISLNEYTELFLQPVGNEILIKAALSWSNKVCGVLIGIIGQIDNKNIATATIAQIETKHDRSLINADFGAFSVDKTSAVKLHTNAVISPLQKHKNLGLLSMNNLGFDTMQLCLHVMTNDKKDSKDYRLGDEVSVKEVRDIVHNYYKTELRLDKAEILSKEKIMILGTKLANLTMSPEGHNTLATQFNLIESLVVFSTDNDLTIPWEWLRPQPTGNHLEVPVIGEIWDVTRWPITQQKDIVSYIAAQEQSDSEEGLSEICTIGLGADDSSDWRYEFPENLIELQMLVKNKCIVHLIGHCDKDTGNIQLGNLTIDSDSISAFPLLGPKYVIVSSCSSAVTPISSNAAITISKTSKASVFAPVVPISKDSAIHLDDELKRYIELNGNASVDKFFRDKKLSNPFFLMYIKFSV